jgi:hypothetical protein
MPPPVPDVEEDLSDGLKLSLRGGSGLAVTRIFHCKELQGTTPIETFASALKLTAAGLAHTGGNVPAFDDILIVNGVELHAREFDLDPFPPVDATVTVNYLQVDPIVAGFGPTIIEVGSSVEESSTEFSADEAVKPYALRTPLVLLWDRSSAGAPGASAEKKSPRVPYFAGKSVRRYTRQQSTNPETIADVVVGCTNSTTWKGLPQDAAMCVEYTGRYSGDGIWTINAGFAVDRNGLFRQVARAIDSTSGEPVFLTQAQFAASNGAQVVRVQQRFDFNALGL